MWLTGLRRFPLLAPDAGDAGGGGAGGDKKVEGESIPKDELAKLRDAQSQLTKLLAQSEADKKKAKDDAAAAAKDAEAKGELAKALEANKARVAELEPFEADAKAWRDHQAAELKRIDERKAALPEAVQKAIDAASGLAAKTAILAAFDVAPPGKTPAKPPAPGAPPGNADPIDFAEAFKDSEKWKAAKARDEKGANAWFAQQARGSSQPVSFQRVKSA